MSHDMMHRPFPRAPLFGAIAMVALALVTAGAGRVFGPSKDIDTSSPVEIVDLRFIDRTDGRIQVVTANDGTTVDLVEPGTNGFLRGTMRGLAQERVRQGLGAETPFRLTAWGSGRLTLDDPVTGRHIDLGAFGPTNIAVFARLLPKGGAS